MICVSKRLFLSQLLSHKQCASFIFLHVQRCQYEPLTELSTHDEIEGRKMKERKSPMIQKAKTKLYLFSCTGFNSKCTHVPCLRRDNGDALVLRFPSSNNIVFRNGTS